MRLFFRAILYQWRPGRAGEQEATGPVNFSLPENLSKNINFKKRKLGAQLKFWAFISPLWDKCSSLFNNCNFLLPSSNFLNTQRRCFVRLRLLCVMTLFDRFLLHYVYGSWLRYTYLFSLRLVKWVFAVYWKRKRNLKMVAWNLHTVYTYSLRMILQ